jgi:hypothetical protein
VLELGVTKDTMNGVKVDKLCGWIVQFAAFLRAGMVHDLLSLYSDNAKRLYSVLSLGENICGHPKTVHGGT